VTSSATKATDEPEDPDPGQTTSPRSRRRWRACVARSGRRRLDAWPLARPFAASRRSCSHHGRRRGRWRAQDLQRRRSRTCARSRRARRRWRLSRHTVRASHGLIGADACDASRPAHRGAPRAPSRRRRSRPWSTSARARAGSVSVGDPARCVASTPLRSQRPKAGGYLLVCADAAVPLSDDH